MPVSAEHIAAIEFHLSRDHADDADVAALRPCLQGLSLTRCDTSDVDLETAFREYKRYNVYLVDASDHCWTMTIDPARATGVVIGKNRVKTA